MQPATTKLSSKGQVVIPEEIRKRLGLEAGAQFVVVGEGDVVVLKALKAPKMADFKALLNRARKSAKATGLTEADVKRAIREVRAKKLERSWTPTSWSLGSSSAVLPAPFSSRGPRGATNSWSPRRFSTSTYARASGWPRPILISSTSPFSPRSPVTACSCRTHPRQTRLQLIRTTTSSFCVPETTTVTFSTHQGGRESRC